MSTFAIIDDNQAFLDALKTRWNAIEAEGHPDWRATFLYWDSSESDEELGRIASGVRGKDHVLLDGSLVSETLLTRIVTAAPAAKLWMVTGWQREEEIDHWEQWRNRYPTAQAQWFEKPLDLGQILATLDASAQDQRRDEMPSLAWSDWPVPCRLFDGSFISIAANPSWRIAVDAFPAGFSEEDKKQLADGEAVILDTWCECPDLPRHYGQVRFHTFPVESYYLQMGQTQPKARDPDVDAAVEEIFTLMLDSGSFTRARYYEVVAVPGSAGVLRLIRASHALNKDLSTPVAYPIGQTLATRLERYARRRVESDRSRLIYQIRRPEEDVGPEGARDADIDFWNDVAGAEYVPWLDLPIYPAIPPNTSKDRDRKGPVAALLIFDRAGREDREADDTPGTNITDEMVERLAPRLMNAIGYLHQTFTYKAAAEELDDHRIYATWHETLIQLARADEQSTRTGGTTGLEQAALEAVKRHTRADSVFLAMHPPSADYLAIRAFDDETMRGLRLPLDRQRFIAVQCAETKEPIFVTDYPSLPAEKSISEEDWRAALAHLGLDAETCAERVADCQAWLRNVKSVVALPVKYDEQVLEVLVMRHQDPFHFTARDIAVAQTLINYAQPYLRNARASDARDAWDSMIMHNMRTAISDIRAQADFVLHPSPQVTSEVAAERIFARSAEMLGQANQVMYLLGYGDRGLREPYNRSTLL